MFCYDHSEIRLWRGLAKWRCVIAINSPSRLLRVSNLTLVCLQDRLHVATAEVNRLRQERRRLMDVSNELRAIIHKASDAYP